MYRKFIADHFFDGYKMLPGSTVLVTDESGMVTDMIDRKDAGEGIETLHGLLTPGFINVHCHLELSHLKGMIPEKTGLVEFVQQVMRGRASDGELKTAAMLKAADEMYNTGTVAVGDICNTADSIPVKQLGKLLWHNFIEVSGFTDGAAQKRLDDIKKIHSQFRTLIAEHRSTLSPHAPYSVSKKLFQLLNAETANQLVTIHNQECAEENDLYRYGEGGFLALYKNFGIDYTSFQPTGNSAFQSWLPYFTNGQSIISVHNTFTGRDDLAFFNNRTRDAGGEVFYCLCINANQYIEQKIPPVSQLKENNCTLVIGTDSYASNRQLNMLEEIKTIQQETNYTIPLPELLRWATINGARALQLQRITGSFENGKKPGIVLIEGLANLQTTQNTTAKRIL